MQGIGAAGTTSMAMALTGDLFKGGEQSKVLGLVEASNGLGKVVSPIIGSYLLYLSGMLFFCFPDFLFSFDSIDNVFYQGKKVKQRTDSYRGVRKRTTVCF